MNDLKLPTLKCRRCEHEWIPRSPFLPKVCPSCNSPYWDKEKGWYKKMKEEKKQKRNEEAGDLSELSYDLRDRKQKK